MGGARVYVRTEEILSFVVTAGVMLISSFFFPTYYGVFIFLAIVDGLSTGIHNELLISLDRLSYAFIVLVLGGIALGLSIIPMILETVSVIAQIDILFLLRGSWELRIDPKLFRLIPTQ